MTFGDWRVANLRDDVARLKTGFSGWAACYYIRNIDSHSAMNCKEQHNCAGRESRLDSNPLLLSSAVSFQPARLFLRSQKYFDRFIQLRVEIGLDILFGQLNLNIRR